MKASARERTRNETPRRSRTGTKIVLALAAGVVLAGAVVALWVAFSNQPASAGATLSSYEWLDRQSIQDELDRQVRESMMTIAVSPTCTIEEDGSLSLRVINDESNRMPQSFTLSQDGEELYRSERIDPGYEITSCPADGVVEGSALVTVQGLDPETGRPWGSSSSVEVNIVKAA